MTERPVWTWTWTRLLAAYGLTFLIMGTLDALWLGWLALDFYKRELGPLMADPIRVLPAAMYYLLYPAAILYLALTPTPARLSVAALRSAVLGASAFGVYDLTNLATLRGYTPLLTVVDLSWGIFATTVGGSLTFRWVQARQRAG